MFKNRLIVIAFFIALVSANTQAHDDTILESLAKRPGVVVLVLGAVTATCWWLFKRSPSKPSRESPADLCERLREENAELKRVNDAIKAQVLELENRVKHLVQMHAEEEAAAGITIERLEADIEHLANMLDRARRRHQPFATMPSPTQPETDHLLQALRNANEDLEFVRGARRGRVEDGAEFLTNDEAFGRVLAETNAGGSSL